MHTKQTTAKLKRMTWSDYAAVYARQTLGVGKEEAAPRDWLELVTMYGRNSRELVDSSSEAADEIFGKYNSPLSEVKKLTLAESCIVARMDLTHAEKIEAVKPLRAKREAAAIARENRPYKPSRYELEYLAAREQRITAAVAEATEITEEDKVWAMSFGLTL